MKHNQPTQLPKTKKVKEVLERMWDFLVVLVISVGLAVFTALCVMLFVVVVMLIIAVFVAPLALLLWISVTYWSA